MAINLPNLVQKVKIDTKDMTAAAAQATAFGNRMKAMSKDVDAASTRIRKSLQGVNTDLDKNSRTWERATGAMQKFRESTGNAAFARHTRTLRDISTGNERVGTSTRNATRDIHAMVDGLGKLPASKDVQVDAHIDTKLRGEKVAAASLAWLARNRDAHIDVKIDKDQVAQVMSVFQKISGTLTGLGNTGGLGIWKSLAMPAGITSGIMAAIPLIGALGNSIVTLSQVALVAPAALAGMGAAFGPLALALVGMKDATDKATKSFLSSMEKIGKSWQKVRADMREQLFEGLGKAMQSLSRTAIPQLRSGLLGISSAWNQVALRFVDFVKQPQIMGQLKTILGQTVPLVKIFGDHLTGTVQAFLNLAQAGMPAFKRLGDSITSVIKSFTDWTAKGLKDGSIARMIDDGVAAVRRLWTVVETLWDAFDGMWGSAKMAGVDFIGVLQTTATWLSKLFNNPFVQRGLADAFIGVRELIGGILGDIRPLASILSSLGGIIRTVGGYLGDVARAALPYLAAGFKNLSSGIGSMMTTLGPFIEVVHAIGPAFVSATASIGPFISSVASFISGAVRNLAPVVKNIADTVAEWLPKAFNLARAAMDAFGNAIAFIAPTLSKLVDFVRPIVSGLLDFGSAVIRATGPLLPIVAGLLALAKAFTVVKAALIGSAAVQAVAGFGAALGGIPFGPVATKMGGFSTAVGRFIGTLKAGQGASTAFSGLLTGMLGSLNLFTAALVAAGAAFVWYSTDQANVSAGAERLAKSLDKATGAVTPESVKIMDDFFKAAITDPKEWAGLESIGLGFDTVTAALTAGGPAAANMKAKLDALNASAKDSPKYFDGVRIPIKELGNAVDDWGNEATAARQKWELTKLGATGIKDALLAVGAATSESTLKTKTYADALSALATPYLTARRAARELKTAEEESNAARAEWLKTHKNTKTALDETTKGYQDNQAALDGVASAMVASLAAAEAHGASQTTLAKKFKDAQGALKDQAMAWGMSSEEADKYVASVLKVPKDVGTTIRVFSDEALAAIAYFNLELAKLPSTTTVSIDSNGDIITKDINGLVTVIGKLPAHTKLVIDSNGDKALVPIKDLQTEIKNIPKTSTVKVNAEGTAATVTDINGVKTVLAGVPKGKKLVLDADGHLALVAIDAVNKKKMNDKTAKLDADKKPAEASINSVEETMRRKIAAAHPVATLDANKSPATSSVNAVEEAMRRKIAAAHPVAKLDANPNPAMGGVGRAQGSINGLHGKTVPLSARDYVSSVVGMVQRAINLLHGKTVNITTNYTVTGRSPANSADGNIFTPYASGGINKKMTRFATGTENHIAQIASAGEWRLWAEPETGGESYIPLAPWKRKRSREIWAMTGRYLGFPPDILNEIMNMQIGGVLSDRARRSNRDAPMPLAPVPARTPTPPAEPTVVKNFYFTFEVHNPTAETTSETTVKEVTRLAALGVFR